MKEAIENAVDEIKKKRKGNVKMKVEFVNNEFPHLPLEFTYINKEGKVYKYRLEPGKVYELPKEVVDYLNALGYPRYQIEEDKETGVIRHVKVGMFKRFSLMPVE